MITIGSFKDISEEYDEIWLIVRSLKNMPYVPNTIVYHIPVLSPSPELFQCYLSWKDSGHWNKQTFETLYKPRFLKEMESTEAQGMLALLKSKSERGKHILLACYCASDEMCHRSLVYQLATGKSMCATGRRPKDLHGYDHDKYIPMVEATKECLREHIRNGYVRFVSGGAQGFDQIFFWAVNALKREGYNIKNVVYVPFRGQERAWKATGLFSQSEYNLMLNLADEVHYLREIDVNNRHAVVDALYQRNFAMVNDTDATFGLYPDYGWQLSTTRGGTAHCLQYARSQNKPIFQLSNETLRGQWL